MDVVLVKLRIEEGEEVERGWIDSLDARGEVAARRDTGVRWTVDRSEMQVAASVID